MKRMKNMSRTYSKAALLLLILAIFLVSGQTGCPEGTGTGIGTGTPGGTVSNPTTSASKTGLDFAFVSGPEYLSSGKKIVPDEIFYVSLLLENSDTSQKGGTICIRDNIEDVYGGIASKECKSFTVQAAIYDSNNKLVSTGTVPLLFGSYKYSNDLLTSQDVLIYVTANYADQSSVSGQINVPGAQTETLKLTASPSPLTVKVDKSLSPREDGYMMIFGIDFSNSNSNSKISTPDGKKLGLIIDPKLNFRQLDCEYADPLLKYVQFDEGKSTKYIRCSTVVPKEETAYSFVMQMLYAVQLEKQLSFKIEKAAAAAKSGTLA